ncbi:hypothetical protein CHF27_011180 [Romboutsia maritimum]|uniref:Uncharacterized protein n=1 Tax=Romboutsia maritimum TaxID=2020948 RepID=A0A371IQX7_9FIRM|nr:hypothetical protein [Romboutsia maritimum]RDY22874.1 hypothetical protein CHF27_011180 [Romboutsia maritimum]
MYEYSICNQADEEIFKKQCKALEDKIPNLEKCNLLTDVDESKLQKYILNGNEINVYNSYYINEVYIKSQIELTQYFK